MNTPTFTLTTGPEISMDVDDVPGVGQLHLEFSLAELQEWIDLAREAAANRRGFTVTSVRSATRHGDTGAPEEIIETVTMVPIQ